MHFQCCVWDAICMYMIPSNYSSNIFTSYPNSASVIKTSSFLFVRNAIEEISLFNHPTIVCLRYITYMLIIQMRNDFALIHMSQMYESKCNFCEWKFFKVSTRRTLARVRVDQKLLYILHMLLDVSAFGVYITYCDRKLKRSIRKFNYTSMQIKLKLCWSFRMCLISINK